MATMDVRKSTWGIIFTAFCIVISLFTAAGAVFFFLGAKVTIGSFVLSQMEKLSSIIGILLLLDGVILSTVLILMMKREHFLDEKPALKLTPILVSGILSSVVEYLINQNWKWLKMFGTQFYLPTSWIFYLILYFIYLYAHSFRPWRPVKRATGMLQP